MSTASIRRRRWTRRDYDRLVEARGFGPEDRIELLDGEIREMTPQGSSHAAVYTAVHVALRQAFGAAYHMRCQLPLALDDESEPVPDIAVVRGAPFDYLDEHPRDALLVVEVSESSLAAYARNRIPEYWLFDLTANQLEVYREPTGADYATKQVLTRADTVAPLHASGAAIAVSGLLPA